MSGYPEPDEDQDLDHGGVDQDLRDALADAERAGDVTWYGRRRPGLWILGAIALGVGLGTFSFWCWAAVVWMRFH